MIRNKKPCPVCNLEISLSNFKLHTSRCPDKYTNSKNNPNKQFRVRRSQIHLAKVTCEFCNKEYRIKGIGAHIWRKHGDGQNFKIPSHKAWNKGLTKETSAILLEQGKQISKTLKARRASGIIIPSNMSEEARKRLSKAQSLNNRGGKCRWFDIDGISVQGTWERDFAIHMNEIKIKWIKPKLYEEGHSISYNMQDRKRTYTPDFYLPDLGIYIEIKGYWWNNDKEKMQTISEQCSDFYEKIRVVEKQFYHELLQLSKEEFIKRIKTF